MEFTYCKFSRSLQHGNYSTNVPEKNNVTILLIQKRHIDNCFLVSRLKVVEVFESTVGYLTKYIYVVEHKEVFKVSWGIDLPTIQGATKVYVYSIFL